MIATLYMQPLRQSAVIFRSESTISVANSINPDNIETGFDV